MERLQGKVVLITGGSSGIGRATALHLASAGARLALVARTEKTLQEAVQEAAARGAEALAIPADVTDAEQCRHAVQAAVDHFGRLDVLLCSAGISMRSWFADSDLATLERVVRVNFFGTLYATYHAIPHIKRTRGSLVALSSLTGQRGTPTYAIYGASKFAIQGLYASLRMELAGDGVHVGIVAPGFVDTPLRQNVLAADGRPWPEPPDVPFRLWPVERCVRCIVDVIEKRKAEVVLPGFVRPLLGIEYLLGSFGRAITDRVLLRTFSRNSRAVTSSSPPPEPLAKEKSWPT